MEPRRRVMIVDDDDDVRDTIAHVLRDEGCEVTYACNGRDALDVLDVLAGAELPSVILLDLTMPVMDGRAFRTAQRQTPRIAAIPVVLLTAAAGFRQPTFDADHVLAKPVTLDDLVRTVARFC